MIVEQMLLTAVGGLVAQIDPISGGAGWVGTGLLGAVLSWLLLKHLPDKDRQIREVIADFAAERTRQSDRFDNERMAERQARHSRLDEFNKTLLSLMTAHEKAVKEMQTQHLRDAEADRATFMDRNDRLLEAIRLQTADLRLALADMIKGVCQAANAHHHGAGPNPRT